MKLILVLLLVTSFAKAETYNCTYFTQTDVGATTVSVNFLPIRKDRRCIAIQNHSGASTLYIKFDSAHTGTENLTLGAGSTWEPVVIPVNKIYLRSSAGSVTTTILEGR